MFARSSWLLSAGALGAVCALLTGCGSSAPTTAGGTSPAAAGRSAGVSQPATTGSSASAGASASAGGNQSGAVASPSAGPDQFSAPLTVDNPMFPLAVGTQFTYQGRIVQDGESKPHSVTFTVSDVNKTVDGVRTVVAWDRDFLEGKLQEQELAFFAQDNQGNVWNFGEYPEEYDGGKFTGAPSTWIRGADGAYGGIHMLSQPRLGMKYREGLVPSIEFDDVSVVSRTIQQACLAGVCYHQVLVVDETSPNDPTSGHQIKYYAPRTGLIQVAARGGDTQEFLTLTGVRHLGPADMAKVRSEVLAMDKRAYKVSKVYATTKPAEPHQA
jgi:hypothetical protein